MQLYKSGDYFDLQFQYIANRCELTNFIVYVSMSSIASSSKVETPN